MKWNVAPEYISLIFISILMMYSREYNMLPTLKNKLFRLCLFFVFFEIIVSISSIVAIDYYRIIPDALNQAIQTVYFLVSPLIAVLFMFYLISVVRENDPRTMAYFRVSLIPYFIYMVVVLVNPFTGFLYSISQSTGFVFGKGFILATLFPVLYVIIMLLIILFNRKRMEKRLILVLTSFPIISLFMLGIQWFFPTIIFSGAAATAALLIVYLYLQNKQIILDDLTGLQNRKTFSKMLLLNMKRKANMDILLVSLDNFKTVNDKFGYLNGDGFLKTITQYLTQVAPIKCVYRFGGDEFIVMLENERPEVIRKMAMHIMKRFEDYWNYEDYRVKIATSLAVIKVPEHADTMESIISLLEYCIELSKKTGKGKIVFSDIDKVEKLNRKNRIIERIKWGLAHDRFDVHYQPIFSAQEKRFTTAEALLRFDDPELRAVSVIELIAIAEETGLIVDIGLLVLDKVCKFIKKLDDAGTPFEGISLNLSAVQLRSEGFVEKFVAIIHKNQINPGKLRMEITESVFIDDAEFIDGLMQELSEYGIRFYMDDFGTGYSNIATIINLPFEFIKIDKSILYESILSKKCYSVLTGFCRTFFEVGMKIVIEGVENAEQRKIAEEIKADYIQGYLFARPMPENEVIRYIGESPS
jgi:diguanylate cyclase (GGDEF)-like protein